MTDLVDGFKYLSDNPLDQRNVADDLMINSIARTSCYKSLFVYLTQDRLYDGKNYQSGIYIWTNEYAGGDASKRTGWIKFMNGSGELDTSVIRVLQERIPEVYSSEAEISSIGKDSRNPNKLYVALDTQNIFVVNKETSEFVSVGGSKVVVDALLNNESTNPVQNKVVNAEFTKVRGEIDTKVAKAVSDLVNGSPETLDTLAELAAALQNNPDIIQNLLNGLNDKADKDTVYTKGAADDKFVAKTDVVDNLDSTSTTAPLSANQGKIIKDLLNLGYTFGGYINKSSTPSVTDIKTFYICTEEGIYDNLEGIDASVGMGIVMFLENGVKKIEKLDGIQIATESNDGYMSKDQAKMVTDTAKSINPFGIKVTGGGYQYIGLTKNVTVNIETVLYSLSIINGNVGTTPSGVKPNEIYIDGVKFKGKIQDTTNSQPFNGIANDKTFSVRVTYLNPKTGATYDETGSTSIKFVPPIYYGAVSSSTTSSNVTTDLIKSLSLELNGSRYNTFRGQQLNVQKFLYAYPDDEEHKFKYGPVDKVFDKNGFEITSLFEYVGSKLITVDNINGQPVEPYTIAYRVYLAKSQVTNNNATYSFR